MSFQFTEEQIKRYSRHIILPEVGGVGQQKLLNAKVLVIGAGGLGSPSLYYLAAAGVGTIGIVDFDVVDYSNLQRQILHNTSRVGVPKVESAKMTIEALNPDVKVITYNQKIDKSNVLDIIKDYDIVLDGSDNFPTRFLINDACFMLGKPLVSAAILRFEGQLTTFDYRNKENSPCYRCLFPEPPPPGLVPSCQEAGLLGVVGGIMGTLQANEALKLILDIGEPLVGKLLVFDALTTEFRTVKLRKDKKCNLCGENPTIKELIEYEQSCEVHF
ncbi:thiazole biosynthesis adenylyltransferase ThiF [Venenivibrio stagnispumantis]|uniref:Molybdopterin-synthase adenylyltransferase n=1 Tax=Venenivibrio stagnispumantis TaxID=407998 RepID=A0AA46AF26_9AQUI|nr:molybdopterin-synthase adenylyltransferase MoeB [Venenivibrio stagnispumantis]MCW4573583.1 molybdopterin-synthase adenylyltransferase MoeB [Venenivibrio stagnispumantis]SMP16724.1 adenylyltransferase and sulfurtransferase [Venenivibrio stagnispumantis]